jgi:phosphoglycolate phosphatase
MLILRSFPTCPREICLFDFDGTLSLIREGWQSVMIDYMVDRIQAAGTSESPTDIRRLVEDYVVRLTGKQTIYQMLRLREEIVARGGRAEDALLYKREYHERLWRIIEDRLAALEDGRDAPDAWLVPGSREMLAALRDRGLRLYLASGTDEAFVVREAELLGVDAFFERRIHGAVDHYRTFSKRILIERVFREEKVDPAAFVAFGDGYVEIEETRKVGGIAVGIASNEDTRRGLNEWKLRRLREAGADIIVGDFSEKESLLEALSI